MCSDDIERVFLHRENIRKTTKKESKKDSSSEVFFTKACTSKNYNEATTSLNASVVSLAPPSAESESSDTFFPTIFLFATLLNRLWYCILS